MLRRFDNFKRKYKADNTVFKHSVISIKTRNHLQNLPQKYITLRNKVIQDDTSDNISFALHS
jgi:hypothetical protein